MTQDRPVLLGGKPILSDDVPLARPTIEVDDDLGKRFEDILSSGILTKGRQVSAFEAEVAEFAGVAHAVAVSSCTTGLMLVLRCLGLRGDVVMPSFTFMASGHALRWNGLRPVFADVDAYTCTLAPSSVATAMTGGTAAVLAVHTFGTPCDGDALAGLAAQRGVPLIFDAAPAFGASYADGAMAGTKGIAEVFSLSPTKPFTSGEGGIVTTDDADLAREVRIGREYGNPGNFDSLVIGLSGRLPELSAALGRNNLHRLPARLTRRRELADRYRRGLAGVPGIGFQRVPAGATSTFKDFCLIIDPTRFGIDADAVAEAMGAERITTRRYYDPPVHRQTAYLTEEGPAHPQALPNTESVAARALTVPLHLHMDERLVDQICEVLRRIHVHAGEIAEVRGESGTDTESKQHGFTR